MNDMNNKICLITGASRGLGKALALEFGRRGAKLVINSRASSANELSETERELRDLGAQVLSVVADVSLRTDVERLAGEALARFGYVDVLVNNASALGPTPMPYLIDYPIDDFEQVIRTNMTGPFMLTRALVGQMLAAQIGIHHQRQFRCGRGRVRQLGRVRRLEGGTGSADPHLGSGAERNGCTRQQCGPGGYEYPHEARFRPAGRCLRMGRPAIGYTCFRLSGIG